MVAVNFRPALREVLRHEGGVADHPRDPGGLTNLGVTIGTAKANGMDVDGDGDVDRQDVLKLTPAHVEPLYKRKYWDAVEGDRLPAGVDLMTFDAAVNSGPVRARRWLQEAAGVKQDGVIGPKTLAALNAQPPAETIENLRKIRDAFYRSLSHFDVFGRGWLRRLAGVTARSLQLAGVK